MGRGRESRHDAATDSFMVMSDRVLYGGDYMKTEDSSLDASMKRLEIVVLMNMLFSDPE